MLVLHISFQGDLVGGVAFLGVDKVGVDLGGGDILVRQHFEDSVDVCSHRELECSICDSEAPKFNIEVQFYCL